ncbi:unnamed protein product [Vitrella brassicaformis CCMP3155]|uniref:Uncharacterized protein n=1 Tax=Vitrella brassicaformis (strain CCMP3155) TaxID=1169540 RepID=A0A0G4EPF5_VITBC|nr:unnamed protein product [Vitrella brassicaformis CCMP3155]|eukprot:CEL99135.1 unnamed protein product [Vitrella brassicaformis CCMP3155]
MKSPLERPTRGRTNTLFWLRQMIKKPHGAALSLSTDTLDAARLSLEQREYIYDEWIGDINKYLTCVACFAYAIMGLITIVVISVHWMDGETFVMRWCLLFRVFAYATLIVSSVLSLNDREPSHPGYYLPWHAVLFIVVVTIVSSSRYGAHPLMHAYGLVTVLVDAILIAFTDWRLRLCLAIVRRKLNLGEITQLHLLSWKYLAFIPSIELIDVSARRLLWQDAVAFDELRDVGGMRSEAAFADQAREERRMSAAYEAPLASPSSAADSPRPKKGSSIQWVDQARGSKGDDIIGEGGIGRPRTQVTMHKGWLFSDYLLEEEVEPPQRGGVAVMGQSVQRQRSF